MKWQNHLLPRKYLDKVTHRFAFDDIWHKVLSWNQNDTFDHLSSSGARSCFFNRSCLQNGWLERNKQTWITLQSKRQNACNQNVRLLSRETRATNIHYHNPEPKYSGNNNKSKINESLNSINIRMPFKFTFIMNT